MIVRTLNADGIAEAVNVLDRLRTGELGQVPVQFLESEQFSRPLAIELKKPTGAEISNRWLFGVWLWKQLQPISSDTKLMTDPGLWTWLAFFLFDLIAPVQGDVRKIGQDARYILARGDYRRYYRHLVSGPYLMVRTHSDEPHIVRGILATALHAPGDVYEQLASRPQIVNSSAAMSLATKLYFSRETQQAKRGAAGAGGGSARRYASVMMQYDVTFDLFAVDEHALEKMLPREFSRFLEPS